MTVEYGRIPDSLPKPAAPRRSRSLYAQAFHQTVGRTGARVGLGWVLGVMSAGVFAPLIASSHPIWLRRGGHLESPMLANLSWIDVLLPTLYCAAVVLLLLKRVPGVTRLIILAGVLVTAGGITYLTVHPKELVSLSASREAEADGTVTGVVRTIVPYSPSDRFMDRPTSPENEPPSLTHWLGTTPNGEDVLSRMLHASRVATSIGFISTGIALAIGVFIGALMGYFSGWVDMFGMRLIEIFEAIPTLILLITLSAVYGRSLYMVMVIIGLTGWTGNARFVRAEFLRLRQQDFVHAARALGLPLRSILFKHMLPNGMTPLLISVSFGVAGAILAESTLSFLGLGLVDSPSWGQMLDQARGVGTEFHWWMAVVPGGAIFLTVFAYNIIGEALRDALDPKLLKRD